MATPTKVESKAKPGLAGIEANLPSVAPHDPDRGEDPTKLPANEVPIMTHQEMTSPLRGVIRESGDPKPTRYVRAKVTSYLHGVIVEPGQVTLWPDGVEKLGPNLEEYFFPNKS